MFKKHVSPFGKAGSLLISAIILLPLLASCALPGGPVIPPTQTPPGNTEIPPLSPTPALATPTPEIIPAANTPEATTTSSPLPFPTFTATSPVILPPATSAVSAGNIAFATGTTAGVVQGTIHAGQVITYTLSGVQGQAMVLILESNNSDVSLGVLSPNGQLLLNSANKFIRFQTLLPQTGFYTVQVIGGATLEAYILTAKISEVVNFAAGTSSITLSGTTTNGFLHSYSFSAQAGQSMTASLNVAASTATIDVFGVATGTLLSPAAHANSWTGTLPNTDVYVVEVIPTGGFVISYSLTVSITGPGITPNPTPSPSGSIVFPTGTTGTTINGTIQAGQVVVYTINAGASLPMILDLVSTNNDVTLGVIQPDGLVLLNNANKWIHWQWLLPETGIYKIQVVGSATTEAYSLTVKIPVIVNFAAGTSSSTLSGSTVNGQVFTYALNCAANQTMTVNLNTPATSAYLDIFGLTTGTLLSPTAHATSWTVTLPATQYYMVEVIPTANQVVNYALTVSCTSPTSGNPVNISFTPGTTAGVVQGTIQPGQILYYTIAAAQWQPMILGVESPGNDVTLGLFEANGVAVVPPANKWIHWQGLLPQTETYTIQLAGGAATETYVMTVKIAQRVNFSLGQSSVTLYGTNVNGYVFSYAFKANVNQTMTVTLNQPSSVAYIDVFGIATGSLLSPADKATTWTGVLPAYQDYIVEVIPRNGQLLSYTLTVEIH
jgi:hypothetical protein